MGTKIAVTSQNRRTITPHAGRTRRFLIYEAHADGGYELVDRVELPKDQTLHEWGNRDGHPLYAYDVIIAGSVGPNFIDRMASRGVEVLPTSESDPETAIRRYIDGTLPVEPPHEHHHHDHDHE